MDTHDGSRTYTNMNSSEPLVDMPPFASRYFTKHEVRLYRYVHDQLINHYTNYPHIGSVLFLGHVFRIPCDLFTKYPAGCWWIRNTERAQRISLLRRRSKSQLESSSS